MQLENSLSCSIVRFLRLYMARGFIVPADARNVEILECGDCGVN